MSSNNQSPTGPARQIGRSIWLIILFLCAVFFFAEHDFSFSRSGIDRFTPTEEEIVTGATEGSLVRRIAFLSLGFFAVVSLARPRPGESFRVNGFLGGMLLAFVSWAFLSLIWAEDRSLTSQKLVAFGIFCLGAAAIARRFSQREIILWTFFSTALFVLIGVSAEMFYGTFRPFTSGYRFAGTLHPNIQGINCGLLVISAFAAATTEKSRRRLYWIGTILGFCFLALTGSRTAVAATLVAIAVYLFTLSSKRARIAMAYALSVAFCLVMLVLVSGMSAGVKGTASLGRDDSNDESLDGRTEIWAVVGKYVGRHAIIGYGYGGFWTPTRISSVSDDMDVGIPNSHLAYLEYLLTLGAVGLVAYTLLLFAGIGRAFRFHRLSGNPAFAFCAALLVFCALDGLLESALALPSFLMFLSMVILAQLAFVRRPQCWPDQVSQSTPI